MKYLEFCFLCHQESIISGLWRVNVKLILAEFIFPLMRCSAFISTDFVVSSQMRERDQRRDKI